MTSFWGYTVLSTKGAGCIRLLENFFYDFAFGGRTSFDSLGATENGEVLHQNLGGFAI